MSSPRYEMLPVETIAPLGWQPSYDVLPGELIQFTWRVEEYLHVEAIEVESVGMDELVEVKFDRRSVWVTTWPESEQSYAVFADAEGRVRGVTCAPTCEIELHVRNRRREPHRVAPKLRARKFREVLLS